MGRGGDARLTERPASLLCALCSSLPLLDTQLARARARHALSHPPRRSCVSLSALNKGSTTPGLDGFPVSRRRRRVRLLNPTSKGGPLNEVHPSRCPPAIDVNAGSRPVGREGGNAARQWARC